MIFLRAFSIFCVSVASITLVSCNSEHDFVENHENVFLMSLPSQSNLEHFLVKGGSAVIEFTPPGTSSTSPKVSGLSFSSFNWDENNWLSKESLSSSNQVVKNASGKPVLIHSSNVNQTHAWLALHLYYSNKESLDRSIEIARGTGLPKEWEAKVRAYVAKNKKK